MKVCIQCGNSYKPDKRNYQKQMFCSRLCKSRYWQKQPATKSANEKYYQKIKSDPELWQNHKEKARIYRQTWKGRMYKYQRQARERNICFNLSLKEFESFKDNNCHYCGDKIKGIGIDRINSAKGYILSNCVPCCRQCNIMKSTQSTVKFIAKCKNTVRLAAQCEKILKYYKGQ